MRDLSLAAMLAFSLIGRAHAGGSRQDTVNVYAWAEYFPPSVVSKFEVETGIHVNYAISDVNDCRESAAKRYILG